MNIIVSALADNMAGRGLICPGLSMLLLNLDH